MGTGRLPRVRRRWIQETEGDGFIVLRGASGNPTNLLKGDGRDAGEIWRCFVALRRAALRDPKNLLKGDGRGDLVKIHRAGRACRLIEVRVIQIRDRERCWSQERFGLCDPQVAVPLLVATVDAEATRKMHAQKNHRPALVREPVK